MTHEDDGTEQASLATFVLENRLPKFYSASSQSVFPLTVPPTSYANRCQRYEVTVYSQTRNIVRHSFRSHETGMAKFQRLHSLGIDV